MKKIVGIIGAAAVLASSIFAADVAATVYMTGSLFNYDGASETASLLTLNSEQQQDDDAIKLSFGDDKAGGQFWMWYEYRGANTAVDKVTIGEDGTPTITYKNTMDGDPAYQLAVRSANLWFKPIDQIKVTIGDLSYSTYVERIHWWKAAAGGSYKQAQDWDHRWSSYATVENPGFGIEITPIEGLWINAAVAPGVDTAFWNSKASDQASAYGIAAKYQILENVSTAVSWRDEGYGADKLLAIGADFGNWGTPYYGFLNLRLNFSKHENSYWGNASEFGLRGIVIDNYFKYQLGALTIQENCPVTIRLNTWEDTKTAWGKVGTVYDPSYMTFDIKLSYALDALTPYIEIMNNDAYTPIVFDDTLGDKFGMEVQCGATFNVGACALDLAAKVSIAGNADHDLSIAIPFTARVKW